MKKKTLQQYSQHMTCTNDHVPEKVKRETVHKIPDIALNHTVITHLTLFEGLKRAASRDRNEKKRGALNSSFNICRLRMADNEIKSQFRGCSFSHAAENRLFFIFISLSLDVSVSGGENTSIPSIAERKEKSLIYLFIYVVYYIFIYFPVRTSKYQGGQKKRILNLKTKCRII